MVACHLSEDSKQSRDLMMTVCTAAAAANMLFGLCKMKERRKIKCENGSVCETLNKKAREHGRIVMTRQR